jgi:aminoglycoside phosphotransferase (APT) family kinase protein
MPGPFFVQEWVRSGVLSQATPSAPCRAPASFVADPHRTDVPALAARASGAGNAYREEELEGETRIVRAIKPSLAPMKCVVFPLVEKDGMP